MAKQIKTIPAPSPEACEEVLKIVCNSTEPLTAKAVSHLLAAPHAIKEVQLIPVLLDYVSQGTLHEISPTTAKGKPRYWNKSLADLVQDVVQLAVQSAASPLTAAELSKRLKAPVKLTESQVDPILKQLVAQDRVHAVAADKKGKPRYWNQDLTELARNAALETIQKLNSPVTAKELAGKIESAVKFSEADLIPVLEAAVAAKTLHSFAPLKAKGSLRYWDRDLVEAGKLELHKLLEQSGSQSQAALKKGIKGLSAAQFQDAFQQMLTAGTIFCHPPLPSSKIELFGLIPPAPDPYLKEIGSQLTRIVVSLTAAGVSRDDLRRAMLQVIETAGITFGATVASQPAPEPNVVHVDVIELMRRIEPGAERGALVGARELRRAANVEKSAFDAAVLELAQQEKLSLHRHDFAMSLNQAERDELVADGAGTYYIGMAIRQNDTGRD